MQEKAVAVMQEVKKAVFGKDDIIQKLFMVILAKGHVLLEDNPGVGKTTMALAFSKAMELDYKRIQFTPEIMPADVVGFSVYQKETGTMEYQPGAILCNLFLADEINRTSSKTQSALLEAMEEGSVTVDGITREIPQPFTVIATENPIGSAGTQLLPESQLDRFMVRLSMGYPKLEDEVEILKRLKGKSGLDAIRCVVTASDLLEMQQQVEQVHIDDSIYEFIARLVVATRNHPHIRMGASPRGSIALVRLSRAAAWTDGRDFVIPKDVEQILFDVLEHRLVLNAQAKVAGTTSHSLLQEILKSTPVPKLV